MPKTLRPPPSLSRPAGTRQPPGARSRVNDAELSQGRQRALHNDVAANHLTNVPSSSSSTAAAGSHHAVNGSSGSDVPDFSAAVDSLLPMPPPLPSFPPPPAPPLLTGLGKLPLVTNVGGPDTNTTGSSVPLSPPGPAPVLKSASESASVTLRKSAGVTDKLAAIDMSSIEAARLRLKKTTRTDNSPATCEFCFPSHTTFP